MHVHFLFTPEKHVTSLSAPLGLPSVPFRGSVIRGSVLFEVRELEVPELWVGELLIPSVNPLLLSLCAALAVRQQICDCLSAPLWLSLRTPVAVPRTPMAVPLPPLEVRELEVQSYPRFGI